MNIFNSACNSLNDACNPVITKCIFQIIGDTIKQLQLCQEEVETILSHIGTEEIFMKNRYKLNIDETQDTHKEISVFKDDVLIKRDALSRPGSQLR